jgi:molybdopterin-guanine dinucleotide biosynthesis protein A
MDDTHDVSGVILAGGASSRLGINKALVRISGEALIERVVRSLEPLVGEILIVSGKARPFEGLGLRCVADIYAGAGVLGGLHAGLSRMKGRYALLVGCDMPFLSNALLRYLISLREGYDVVMPRVGHLYEPLHAVYARTCLPTLSKRIAAGERRIRRACRGLRTRYVEAERIAALDPEGLSFFNVNTQDDLLRCRALLREP